MRPKLSYANVVSSLALFLALGGVSYAAINLPKNSVKARHIAKNAVGASEIKAGAVGSSEAAGLRAEDFAPGQLPAGPPGKDGAKGDPGPKGDQGEKGEQGIQGVQGVSGSTTVRRTVGPIQTANHTNVIPLVIPLAGFEQAADETLRFTARVDVVGPSTSCNFGSSAGSATITLRLDGRDVATLTFVSFESTTKQLDFPTVIVEDGAAHNRALELVVYDNCNEANTGFTITQARWLIRKSR